MSTQSPPKRRFKGIWIVLIVLACICLIVLFLGIFLWILAPVSYLPAPTTVPTTQALPDFPWPPPNPSASSELLRDSAGTGLTFGNVNSRIVEALSKKGGYYDISYFGVPNGFAIVTHIEQTDLDGYPDPSNRWVAEIAPISAKNFSLGNYFKALIGAPEGHYRIFVFIVTSNLVVSSGTPVSQAEAEGWLLEGANKLPTWMESLPYTREHTCTAYIYEFVQSGHGAEANQNIPSEITGQQHLERAGLWDTLER